MAIEPGRQYGNADIGGHANVLQGDAHTSTILNISPGNTIHVSVHGKTRRPPATNKRLRDDRDDDQVLCTTQRKRLHFEHSQDDQNLSRKLGAERLLEDQSCQESQSRPQAASDRDLRKQGVHLINQILQASGSREQVSLASVAQMNVHDADALHHIRSALREGEQDKGSARLTLVDHLRRNILLPTVGKILPELPTISQEEAIREVAVLPNNADAIVPANMCGSAQDLVCVFLAMLTMLSCYGAGHGRDGNNHIVLGRTPEKVSLIAGLATFAIARYLCIPAMVRQISEWAGGSLIIKDPFMHELRVPQAHVEHFTLLQAFLRFKLSGTTAEAFIEAGQFNLTLGQRYGRAINKTDWSVKGRVKSDQQVVMSVFLKRRDAHCVECQEQLTMSASGQFACHPCGKVFGNCASLRYLTEHVREHTAQKSTVIAPNKPRPFGNFNSVLDPARIENDEGADDVYDLHGLQNIDFRILRTVKRNESKFQAPLPNGTGEDFDAFTSHLRLVDLEDCVADFETVLYIMPRDRNTEIQRWYGPAPFYVTVNGEPWYDVNIKYPEFQHPRSMLLGPCIKWAVRVCGLRPGHQYTCSFPLDSTFAHDWFSEFGSIQIRPSLRPTTSDSARHQVEPTDFLGYHTIQHHVCNGLVATEQSKITLLGSLLHEMWLLKWTSSHLGSAL